MLRGDFGISYTYTRAGLRTDRCSASGCRCRWRSISLTLTLLIAFPAGILAAARRNSATDVAVMGVTQFGVAVPNFWFAIILVYVFAVILHWFSAGGFAGWDKGFWLGMRTPDPAGHRAGPAAGLDPRARDALGAARHARARTTSARPAPTA